MRKLLLLLLTIPVIGQSEETFTNEQGLKIEYVKPSVSCFYEKKPTKVI